jgi:sugar phosphate isomerase/epimerase
MPTWSTAELAYCSNVHPGIRPEQIEHNLRNITAEIRRQRGLSRMHAGLWINQEAANAYQSPAALDGLKACLAEQNLDVVTLNGFPQGNFHEAVVKQKVYLPTWAEKSRLNYTTAIANILASCMPADQVEGTISTLPLGYRLGWDENKQHFACRNLCQFALAMAHLEDQTGKHIRLCLEMEPGCALENTEQVVELFTQDLPRAARAEFVEATLLERYLGVCYDVCHQAVMQEGIDESIGRLHQAGIYIGKIQVSSALRVDHPSHPEVRARLNDFAEPKYLHQLSTRDSKGEFVFRDDLIDALAEPSFPDQSTWWVHFHLPIQVDTLEIDGLSTTRDRIEQVCDYLASSLPYAPHLEVETYTWEVLPAGHWSSSSEQDNDGLFGPQQLIEGIVNEMKWFERTLDDRKLLMA